MIATPVHAPAGAGGIPAGSGAGLEPLPLYQFVNAWMMYDGTLVPTAAGAIGYHGDMRPMFIGCVMPLDAAPTPTGSPATAPAVEKSCAPGSGTGIGCGPPLIERTMRHSFVPWSLEGQFEGT